MSTEEPRPQGNCYQCGMADHIAKDCPQGSAKTCYNCGEVGHLSRNCENPKNEDAPKPPQRNRNGRARKPQKCYNCGDLGHISAECPDKANGPKCYNCGNFGHVSSACTDAPVDA